MLKLTEEQVRQCLAETKHPVGALISDLASDLLACREFLRELADRIAGKFGYWEQEVAVQSIREFLGGAKCSPNVSRET